MSRLVYEYIVCNYGFKNRNLCRSRVKGADWYMNIEYITFRSKNRNLRRSRVKGVECYIDEGLY